MDFCIKIYAGAISCKYGEKIIPSFASKQVQKSYGINLTPSLQGLTFLQKQKTTPYVSYDTSPKYYSRSTQLYLYTMIQAPKRLDI